MRRESRQERAQVLPAELGPWEPPLVAELASVEYSPVELPRPSLALQDHSFEWQGHELEARYWAIPASLFFKGHLGIFLEGRELVFEDGWRNTGRHTTEFLLEGKRHRIALEWYRNRNLFNSPFRVFIDDAEVAAGHVWLRNWPMNVLFSFIFGLGGPALATAGLLILTRL